MALALTTGPHALYGEARSGNDSVAFSRCVGTVDADSNDMQTLAIGLISIISTTCIRLVGDLINLACSWMWIGIQRGSRCHSGRIPVIHGPIVVQDKRNKMT